MNHIYSDQYVEFYLQEEIVSGSNAQDLPKFDCFLEFAEHRTATIANFVDVANDSLVVGLMFFLLKYLEC